LLFALSWVTPSSDGRQFGAVAFVESARFAWNLLSTGNLVPGLCMLSGWLANFSIAVRLPPWARVISCAAPWLAYTVVLLKLPVRPSLPARAAFFLYFYPWAVGIALIHLAHFQAHWRKPAPTGALQ
jgi:hypothetical protein